MSTRTTEQSAHGPRLHKADGSPIRVLVVDDEPLAHRPALDGPALRGLGGAHRRRRAGRRCTLAREFRPDVIVLDIMLPDIDGLQVLQRGCGRTASRRPVLFLTAKDSVDDRVAGLTAGGDDYVTKPFSLEEVVARLRGLIRRSTLAVARREPTRCITVGDLTLDEDSYEVRRAGDADRADRHRVRAAALPDAQPAPGAQQGADPRPGVELRLRRQVRASSRSTSPTCARRSTPVATPMIHTVRGVGYMLKIA